MKYILLLSIALLPIAAQAQAPRVTAPEGMRVTPVSSFYLSIDDDPVRNQFRRGPLPFLDTERAVVSESPKLDPTRAYLTLQVPDQAEVLLDGVATASTGPTRRFVSAPLESARTYKYNVLVRWLHDGTQVERRLEVPVHAGDSPVIMVLAPLKK